MRVGLTRVILCLCSVHELLLRVSVRSVWWRQPEVRQLHTSSAATN